MDEVPPDGVRRKIENPHRASLLDNEHPPVIARLRHKIQRLGKPRRDLLCRKGLPPSLARETQEGHRRHHAASHGTNALKLHH
jgi:hypothetical protein